jgi:hypothetical protein
MHSKQTDHDDMAATRLMKAALSVGLAFCCAGCATWIQTTQMTSAVPDHGRGELTVRVYETSSDKRRGIETRKKIVSELYRTENGKQRLVREATLPQWSASDLPAGEYELRVATWLDRDGHRRSLAAARHAKFVLPAGRRTTADVIVYGSRSGWYVLGALVGVAIAVGASAVEAGSW